MLRFRPNPLIRRSLPLLGMLLASLIVPSDGFDATWNTPVQAGDCQGCHGSARVLPSGHPRTLEMALDRCRACHKAPGTSLKGKLPLGHAHLLSGVGCAGCHGGQTPRRAPVSQERCMACHGSEPELADLTAGLKINPHDSLHYGPGLACDLCHHAHRLSENFCNQCHEYDFVVP